MKTSTERPEWSGTLSSYVIGFVLSVILTMAAYLAVVEDLFSSEILIFGIVALGIVQLLVQLICFLHLGQESKPRWNQLILFFMLLVIVIIVFGSLWIMYNLDERVMTM